MEYKYFVHKNYILVRKDHFGHHSWLPRAFNNWSKGSGNFIDHLTPLDINNIPEGILSSYTNPVFKKLLKELFYQDLLNEI